MKLYNFPYGPYPQRVTIYIAEKGLTGIELVNLEPPGVGTKWPPAVIQNLSPSGSLPLLVDDDGTVVGQSLAILEYLEDMRDAPNMLGMTARDRVRTRELVRTIDEALTFFAIWARFGSRLDGGGDDGRKPLVAHGAEQYMRRLRLAEQMIVETEFIAGDTVTIADCVAMATLQFALSFYGVPIPGDCPRLANWYGRFSLRPSVTALAYPREQHALAMGLMAQTGIQIST